MVTILMETRASILTRVKYKASIGGDIRSVETCVLVNRRWLAQSGLTLEAAARKHIETKTSGFAGF